MVPEGGRIVDVNKQMFIESAQSRRIHTHIHIIKNETTHKVP